MNGSVARVLVIGCLMTAGLFSLGCGSSGSNNDQGVSFTLNGFAQLDQTDDEGSSGQFVTFGNTPAQVSVELQNNLEGQGIRVRRVYLNYFISGANLSIPSTSVALTSTLGPVACADSDSRQCIQTTLPASFRTTNITRQAFPIVPAAINEFLVLNRDSLPALPFIMEVSVVAEGITTAGDTLQSNEGLYNVEFGSDSGVIEGGSADSSSSSSDAAV